MLEIASHYQNIFRGDMSPDPPSIRGSLRDPQTTNLLVRNYRLLHQCVGISAYEADVYIICPYGLQVNQAVDEMADERSRLQGQLQQAQLDLQTMQQTNKHLEQENGRLLERLSAVEEQAVSTEPFYVYLKVGCYVGQCI